MYKNGQGVIRDYIGAYKWFNISLENGNKISKTYRNYIAKSMTQSQIETAQKLADDWLGNHK